MIKAVFDFIPLKNRHIFLLVKVVSDTENKKAPTMLGPLNFVHLILLSGRNQICQVYAFFCTNMVHVLAPSRR